MVGMFRAWKESAVLWLANALRDAVVSVCHIGGRSTSSMGAGAGCAEDGGGRVSFAAAICCRRFARCLRSSCWGIACTSTGAFDRCSCARGADAGAAGGSTSADRELSGTWNLCAGSEICGCWGVLVERESLWWGGAG